MTGYLKIFSLPDFDIANGSAFCYSDYDNSASRPKRAGHQSEITSDF